MKAHGVGATSFSYTDGNGPASGSSDTGAAVFYGTDAGFMVSSGAPQSGKTSSLSLYIGLIGGAQGNVSATVDGVAGANQDVAVQTNASVVTFTYTGGPLTVRCTVVPGTLCEAPTAAGIPFNCLTLAEKIEFASPRVLGASGGAGVSQVLDWAHWGNLNAKSTKDSWGVDRMKAGNGALAPTLVNGNGPTPNFFHTVGAGLFSWTGGRPTAQATGMQSGVFSNHGTFQLTIPAHGNNAQQLTLYLGVYSTTGRLAIKSGGSGGSVAQTTYTSRGGPAGFKFVISFVGEITVTWANGKVDEMGNVTWEAAVLELLAALPRGGLTLEAITLA